MLLNRRPSLRDRGGGRWEALRVGGGGTVREWLKNGEHGAIVVELEERLNRVKEGIVGREKGEGRRCDSPLDWSAD
jgi:hypothetical protein